MPTLEAFDNANRLQQLLLGTIDSLVSDAVISAPIPYERIKSALKEISLNSPHVYDTALRGLIYRFAISQKIECSVIFTLLDVAFVCADLGLCDQQLAPSLISALYDSQPISQCQQLFSYLETRKSIHRDNNPKSQRLIRDFLSLCNDLLHRLSKSEDTVFRGRIAIYLSSVFPLCDPSGLNVRSDYNVETVTSFDDLSTSNDDMDIDNQEYLSAKMSYSEEESKIDEMLSTMNMDSFYTRFWTLQQAFRDPFSINSPEKRSQLKTNLLIVLAKFKKIEEEQQKLRGAKAAEDRKRGEKRHSKLQTVSRQSSIDSFFNPNFLTSRKLLELELSNLSFRRYILVQMLIFLDDITNERPKGRNLQPELLFELEDEKNWARNLRKLALYTLQATHPDGKSFTRTVETIFSRESNWIKWKSQWKTSATFEKSPLPDDQIEEIVHKYSKAVKLPFLYKEPMGTFALTKLYQNSETASMWKIPKVDDFERPLATLDSKIKSLVEEMKLSEKDESGFAPGDKEHTRMQLLDLESDRECKNWLALRAATRDRLALFSKARLSGDAMKLFPSDSSQSDHNLGVKDDEEVGPLKKRQASEDEELLASFKRPKT